RTKDKTSILEDVDFELELIHQDVINVKYILELLAQLYDADEDEEPKIRKLFLDTVAGEVEYRNKRELIEKFIANNLPKLDSSAEIPDNCEEFWEQERATAFEKLCKEEQLNQDKTKKVIDRYVYTGEPPLVDPDIVDLIERPLKIAERGPTKIRVFEKIKDYVETFIYGMAA
ncbi:type I restriction endonuclease subunit R, partial [bacterium]|nr:type I restriction endonuclease subunit R [bacterium]